MKLAETPTIWVMDAKERLSFIQPVIDRIPARWLLDRTPLERPENPADIDLAIVSDERCMMFVGENILWLREHGVPTLHVIDGIIEWRNCWENPRHDVGGATPAAMFMPVFCDKIACLGPSQVRWLEAFGNTGRCENVGMPRLDALVNERLSRTKDNADDAQTERTEPFRFLVATAKAPAFSEAQHDAVRRGLLALKKWFASKRRIAGRAFQVEWRLTEGLDAEIGVESCISDLSGEEFSTALRRADALVTTPSTTILEGMLRDIPVAVVDFTNSYPYVDTVWRMTATDHIGAAMPELVKPPAIKLLHQKALLNDHLVCHAPAAPRLQTLMAAMIDIGRNARREGKRLEFPPRMVADETHGFRKAPSGVTLADIFPDRDAYLNGEIALLRSILHSSYLTQAKLFGYMDNLLNETRETRGQYAFFRDWLAWLEGEVRFLQLPASVRMLEKMRKRMRRYLDKTPSADAADGGGRESGR